MRRSGRRLAALAAALLFATGPLRAQSQTGVALAETLYQQAREFMNEGRVDEACPKFEESYRLDPATGTLLNLASCHEKQGRLATAWFEYLDAVTMSRRDGRADRVAFAQGRLADLEAKLSRLTIVVPAEADHPGLELELDGARVGPAARGVPTPVDPGIHVIEARAPGRRDIQLKVEIGTAADQQVITLPVLEPSAPVVVAPPPPTIVRELPPEPTPKNEAYERPVPTAAWVSGAVTAGLLAGAVVTGMLYLERQEDYDTTNSKNDFDQARLLGVLNVGLWIGVAAGAGVTTYFYVTRPEEPRGVARSASGIVPGAIANLGGHF
jgi:hypothetical protein